MINNRKILSFFIIPICFALINCGPDNIEVWKAIPCKYKIINCSQKEINTIDVRMLNDDGSINDKVQFERTIVEQNEKKMRYKKDVF